MDKNDFHIKEYLLYWKEYGIEYTPVKKAARKENHKVMHPVHGASSLRDLPGWIGECKKCRLSEGRNKIVIGSGNPNATLMFVGEGPGADEDREGLPFVGRAGQLLTKIIEAMNEKRENVYIANVVKCRPPENRAPEPDEIENCLPFLKEQIRLINPKLIVSLGNYASRTLTGLESPMSSLRGRFYPLKWEKGVSVLPTYHPAYLLRNPSAKKMVWDDMKMAMARLKDEVLQ